MKKLVIYYSLTGHSKVVAEVISKTIDADLLELKTKKETQNKNMSTNFNAFIQMISIKGPKLNPIEEDLNSYDLIFIGTPVWANSYVPVYKSFLKENQINNKKIALFCTCSSNEGKTFTKFKKYLNNNEIIDTISFSEQYRDEVILNNAKEWAKKVIKKAK